MLTEPAGARAYYAYKPGDNSHQTHKWRESSMQESQFSVHNQSAGVLAGALHHIRSVFTPRRLGYTLAGAFVFAGAAVVMNSGTASHHAVESKNDGFDAQTSSSNQASQSNNDRTITSSPSSTSTDFSSSTSSDGTTNTSLNVNGQDIDVPSNGSTHHTVTNSDGSQTTVDVSGDSTSQSSSSNTSHSNFSLNVHSKSSSGGDAK